MEKCTNCGANLHGNYCAYCGARASAKNPLDAVTKFVQNKLNGPSPEKKEQNRLCRQAIDNHQCPVCSTPFKRGGLFKYCAHCGASLMKVSYTDILNS
jgi:rRNA maturation endonuclease Nob1